MTPTRQALGSLLLLLLAATPAAAGWDEAMAAYDAKRYDEAIAGFEAGAEADPDEPRWHYMLGLSLLAAERPAKAAARLEHALELAGGTAAYALPLARAQLGAGAPEAALATLDHHRPSEADGRTLDKWAGLVAVVATAVDDPTAALPLLGEAAEKRPDGADLQLALGRARGSAGDSPGAFAAYQRAFDLDGGGEVGAEAGARAIGTAFAAAEADPAARAGWYRRAAGIGARLPVEGASPDALLLAGDALLLAEQPAEAERRFIAAAAAVPAAPEPRYQLAQCRLKLDDPEGALERLGEALERAPAADLERRIHSATGHARADLEQYEAAARAFRQAGDETRAAEMDQAAAAAEHNAGVDQALAKCREDWARIARQRDENREFEGTAVWAEIDRQAARVRAECGPPPQETAGGSESASTG